MPRNCQAVVILFALVGFARAIDLENQCDSSPCENLATCVDGYNEFACVCHAGFSGQHCEVEEDECGSNPCMHGSQCEDGYDTFTCTCIEGYQGHDCEINADECASSPCQNGMKCQGLRHSFEGNFSYPVTYDFMEHMMTTGDYGNLASGPATAVYQLVDGSWVEVDVEEDTNDLALLLARRQAYEASEEFHLGAYRNLDEIPTESEIPGRTISAWSDMNGDQFVAVVYSWSNPFGQDALYYHSDSSTVFPRLTVSGEWQTFDGSTWVTVTDQDNFDPYSNYNAFAVGSEPWAGFNIGTLDDSVYWDTSPYSIWRYEMDFGPDDYVCDCAAGYTGHNCEINIDDCASSPCENGATCTDLGIGHTFYAAGEVIVDQYGNTQVMEENGEDFNATITYLNVFKDVDGNLISRDLQVIEPPRPYIGPGMAADTYHCGCVAGFAGHNCEQDLDECRSSPCQNGAQCFDGNYSAVHFNVEEDEPDVQIFYVEEDELLSAHGWSCGCVFGFDGSDCEINLDECASSPCQNFASCIDRVYDYECICPDAWEGKECHLSVDDCASNPCNNFGTCTDHHGFYSCLCADGFEGERCDLEEADECSSSPCLNGGSCIDLSVDQFQPFSQEGNQSYHCNCPNGYGGQNCDTFWEYSSIMDVMTGDAPTACVEDDFTTITTVLDVSSKCYDPAPSDTKLYLFFMGADDDDLDTSPDFSGFTNAEFDSLNIRISGPDDAHFERSVTGCSIATHLPSGNYHRVEQHGSMDDGELGFYDAPTQSSFYLDSSSEVQNYIEVPVNEHVENMHQTISGYTPNYTPSGWITNPYYGTFYTGSPDYSATEMDPYYPWRTTVDGVTINAQPTNGVNTQTEPLNSHSTVQNWMQEWGFGPYTDNPQQQITFGLTWERFENLYGYYSHDYCPHSSGYCSIAAEHYGSTGSGGSTNVGDWWNGDSTYPFTVDPSQGNTVNGQRYPMDSADNPTDQEAGFYQSVWTEGLSLIMCDLPSGYSPTLGLDGLFLHDGDCSGAEQVTCSAQDWWVNIQGATYWDFGWQYYRPWAIPEGFYENVASGSDSGAIEGMDQTEYFLPNGGINPWTSSSWVTGALYPPTGSSWFQNFGQMFPTEFTVRDCPTDTSIVSKQYHVKMDIDSEELAAKVDTMQGFLWFSMDEEKTGFAHPEVEVRQTFTTTDSGNYRLIWDPAYVQYWSDGNGGESDICEYYHSNGDFSEDEGSCDWTQYYECPRDSRHPSAQPGERGYADSSGCVMPDGSDCSEDEDYYYTADDYFCCCESVPVVEGIRNWYTTINGASTWSSPFPLSDYEGAWDRLFGGVQQQVTDWSSESGSSFTMRHGQNVPGYSWNSYDSYAQGISGNQNVHFTDRRNLAASDYLNYQSTFFDGTEYKDWYLGTSGRSGIDFLYDNAFKYINYYFDHDIQGNYIPASMNNLYATGTVGIYAGLEEDYSLPVLAYGLASKYAEQNSGCTDYDDSYQWEGPFTLVVSELPVEIETDASEMQSLVAEFEAEMADVLSLSQAADVLVTAVSEYQFHDTVIDSVLYNTFENPMAEYGRRRMFGSVDSGYRTTIKYTDTYNTFWNTAQRVYLSAGLGMTTRCTAAEAGLDGIGGLEDADPVCNDRYSSWYPWRVHVTASGDEMFSIWTTDAWVAQGEKPRCSRGLTTCNQYKITFEINTVGNNIADRYEVDDQLLEQLANDGSALRTAVLLSNVDVDAGLNGWDACHEEPCLNGGQCLAVGPYSYECKCNTTEAHPYSGPDCGELWDSTPDQINARYAYFTAVTGTSAALQWDEPGLGTWEWPIRGYRIRSNATDVQSQSSFCVCENPENGDECDCTCEDANDCTTICEDQEDCDCESEWWCELTGIYSPDSSLADECFDDSCSVVYGMLPDTKYYFEIIAYNLDGDGIWSDPLYALHTHAVPDEPIAPLYVENDDTTVTVTLTYPDTRGTNACEAGCIAMSTQDITYDTDIDTYIMQDKDISADYCSTEGSGSAAYEYVMQYAECTDENCADVVFEDVIIADGTVHYEDVEETVQTICDSDVDVPQTIQQYMFSGLTPNTHYLFKYAAVNAIGQSEFSDTLKVETYDRPATPRKPDFTAVTDSSITLTCELPFDGGVAIDGVRLFAQSLNTESDSWGPATRYTLTNDAEEQGTGNYYYESSPMDTELPEGMSSSEWLEINTEDLEGVESIALDDAMMTFTVTKLSHDTTYRFQIAFQNRVGDSDPSASSVNMKTLEAKVTTVQAYLGPPCIYEDGSPSVFRAVSDGTNTKYKWEMQDGSVIAEGDDNDNCENDSCSKMAFTFPDLGANPITLIAYNTRGMRSIVTSPEVEYCGCTDIYDANYWEHATYHLPEFCDSAESWEAADHDLVVGEEMTYQTYYDENVIEMEVTVRIDTGAVNLYWSTTQIPDVDLDITYGSKASVSGEGENSDNGRYMGISDYRTITIPYEDLYGSDTLYIKLVGAESSIQVADNEFTDVTLSRFQLVAHQSAFTQGAEAVTRQVLNDQVATTDTTKTGYSDFYEYFFAKSEIDVDVEITLTVNSGCVSVFTSLEERYPDARRATGVGSTISQDGYWYSNSNAAGNTDGSVCASDEPEESTITIVHTIKSWEGYDVVQDSVAYRGMFVSVCGEQPYLLGDEQADNEYTITAKIYRYRIDSVLMDFQDSDDLVYDEETGTSYIKEDYRYSVITQDNFNYYQLQLSDTGFAFDVEIELVYGDAEVYVSNSKLPTLDPHLQDADCVEDPCSRIGYDYTKSLEVGSTTSFTIDYSQYNQVGNYVYLGIFGGGSDSSYIIKVTEQSFSTESVVIDAYENTPVTASVSNIDTFFQIYVGPKDEAMEVTARSGAGSRTSDLGADPNTWGIDWTEPLTETWIEQNMDEYDLDVKVSINWPVDADGNLNLPQGTYSVFASTYENYPSEERGYETMEVYTIGSSTSLNDLPQYAISIPHFTFSTRMVYFNIRSDFETAEPMQFTLTVQENLPTSTTSDGPLGASDAIDCPNDCSDNGSCVDGTCLCDDQYLGTDCSYKAFSDLPGQPTISLTPSVDTSIFDASIGGQYLMCYSGVPDSSFVLMYVDGLPYPSKSSNVMFLYTDEECVTSSECNDGCGIDVMIYGVTSVDVDHTLEVILLSEDSQALDTAMASFHIDNDVFCKNDCSGQGVCHNGYCVCFDHYGGEDCSSVDSDENGLDDVSGEPVNDTPGQGYIDYISMQNSQTQMVADYENQIALQKNDYLITKNNAELEIAAAQVKENINAERIELRSKMAELANTLEDDINALHLKREELEIAVQQMREQSNRLQTKNEENYIDFQRDMSEQMTDMQNRLDADLRDHAQIMAEKSANWDAVKAKLQFELNQLKTANGPLVEIDDLKETECTQDEFYQVTCVDTDASDKFQEEPGRVTYESGEWVDGVYEVDYDYVDEYYHNVPR